MRTRDETVDPVFERSWKRFKEGDVAYRNSRLKYMAKIPNASFVVRSTVGAMGGMFSVNLSVELSTQLSAEPHVNSWGTAGFRPVIMGKGYLELKHFNGPNYVEVDIDIGSSRIARGVVGVVIPQAKKMIVDEAFFVEGQNPDELPERLLGICRCVHYDLDVNTLPISPDMLARDEAGGDDAHTSTEPPPVSPLSPGALRDDVVNELGAAFDVEAGVAVIAAENLGERYEAAADADSGIPASALSPSVDGICVDSDDSDEWHDAE